MQLQTTRDIPPLFGHLTEKGCLEQSHLQGTGDGFRAAALSLADILARREIHTFPDSRGQEQSCRLFYDDWYLYALPGEGDYVYSLFKMREQEHDLALGLQADGDAPGVTVSFIALDPRPLTACLEDPSPGNRDALNREIDRVVARRGQSHSPVLKNYFRRSQAQGAYLIAVLYTQYIASLAENGSLPVPERYAADCRTLGSRGRIFRFLESLNAGADAPVCDHRRIFLADPARPTARERLAILATHTGNVSVYSFAAEVQFHAKFLTPWAKLLLPGRSVYASAIRADMSIADGEFTGPTPYYRTGSPLVKNQLLHHRDTPLANYFR